MLGHPDGEVRVVPLKRTARRSARNDFEGDEA